MNENPETMIVMDELGMVWQRDDTNEMVMYRDGAPRPYAPEEILAKEERVAEVARRVAVVARQKRIETALSGLTANVASLQALIDSPDATLNASPATAIKGLANAVKRNLQLVADVAADLLN